MQQFTTIKSIASKLLNIESTSITDLQNLISKPSQSQSAKPQKISDMTNSELFDFIDQEGNKNGTIDTEEFSNLCSQLGVNLTESRVTEVFSKVKGSKSKSGKTVQAADELNTQEFGDALKEIQWIKLEKTLIYIGIDRQNLNRYLFLFFLILVLVVGFLLVGIRAFAMGGTFSTIINSLLPVGNLELFFWLHFQDVVVQLTKG